MKATIKFFITWIGPIIVLTAILFIILLLGSCSLMKNYDPDNFGEEFIEELIEYKTGVDVDLSPFSPEQQ